MTRLAPPSDQEKLLDLGSRANFGLTEKSSPLEHALMRLGDALKGKSAWLT
jgi:hypothetical protein